MRCCPDERVRLCAVRPRRDRRLRRLAGTASGRTTDRRRDHCPAARHAAREPRAHPDGQRGSAAVPIPDRHRRPGLDLPAVARCAPGSVETSRSADAPGLRDRRHGHPHRRRSGILGHGYAGLAGRAGRSRRWHVRGHLHWRLGQSHGRGAALRRARATAADGRRQRRRQRRWLPVDRRARDPGACAATTGRLPARSDCRHRGGDPRCPAGFGRGPGRAARTGIRRVLALAAAGSVGVAAGSGRAGDPDLDDPRTGPGAGPGGASTGWCADACCCSCL